MSDGIFTLDIAGLLVQEAAAHGALPVADAVCKLWHAAVQALVHGWQQRLADEVLVQRIAATDQCAEGLTFYHPPSGSALKVHAERKVFEPFNMCRMRFWHSGQRIKGTCLLAVSSTCINGRMVTAEGAVHAVWAQIEQQKLETCGRGGSNGDMVDGVPRIPADALQAQWHSDADLWPLEAIGLEADVPVLLPPFQGPWHRADATEVKRHRRMRITTHGLVWDGPTDEFVI